MRADIEKTLTLLKPLAALVLGAGMIGYAASAQALTFNFTPTFDTTTPIGASALDGFRRAGSWWSQRFTDAVTINYQVSLAELGETALAQASSTQQLYPYADVYSALNANITSAADQQALNTLPIGSGFDLLINRTSNSPHGSGSDIPYRDGNGDANNSNLRLTTANAKALGLPVTAGVDATLTFNLGFDYDFNRTDGVITPGTFDFVGIAAHEIGHALGFISGVDILDHNSPPQNGPFADTAFTFVSPLDLFRYSAASVAQGTVDWTANNQNKYFSLDGGVSQTALFTTGRSFGDGHEASHWKDDQGFGLMEPAVARGEWRQVSETDLLAFDIIGWNRQAGGGAASLAASPTSVSVANNSLTSASPSVTVPEPSSVLALVVIGAGVLLKQARAKQ